MRLSNLLFIFLLITISNIFAFAGGDGSVSSPYQVNTINSLQSVANYPTSYFILTSDIDASPTQEWNGGDGFEPIGSTITPFSGTFDGQGYTISNLLINKPGGNNRALFSYVDGATISNVMLEDFDITGDSRVAALVAYLNNGIVYNCGCSGQISANSGGGGLIGRMSTSILMSCYSEADVTGRSNGENYGGLVGITENNCTISNCFARGAVSGYNKVGGLVGKLEDAGLSNCYSTGEVNADDTEYGGLVGFIDGTQYADNCFWDIDTSGQNASIIGSGKTTDQMTNFYMYHGCGWDFVYERQNGTDDFWDFELDGSYNDGYPYLVWQDGDAHSLGRPTGNGTSEDPYRIEELYDLFWVSANDNLWNYHFEQTADINAGDTRNWNNGAGFSPIGNAVYFTGTYDGGDYTIDSLYINMGYSIVGLFGVVSSAVIRNVNVEDIDISSTYCAGGVAGHIMVDTVVEHCSATGDVSGGSWVGGIVGYAHHSSQIKTSHSAVNASATFNVGGIVGYVLELATVENCYCTGSVTGNGYVGGCIGSTEPSVSISNCYSTAVVVGNYNDGGFLGAGGNAVTNCFWDIETSGYETSHGGTGKTTAEMKMMSTYTDAGWDFVGEVSNGTNDIWVYFEGEYPILSIEYSIPEIVHVDDISGDQGHQIELLWNRCNLDVTYSPNNFYTVWRRVDNTRAIDTSAIIVTNPLSVSLDMLDENSQILLNDRSEYWTYLMNIPATMYEEYAVVLPTLVDSSASLPESDYTSTYRVLYHFDTGYFTSNSASGYSVDNIAPYATSDVTLAFGGTRTDSATLSWNEVTEGGFGGNSYPEENGVWYRVYTGDLPDFACDETNLLVTTQGTSINVDPAYAQRRFYKIVVSDQP